MSYQHVLKCDLDPGGEVIRAQKSYTWTGHARIDESVANGQTDSQINVAIDVSAVKSIIILADQNVTLETNSGSTPAHTISPGARPAPVSRQPPNPPPRTRRGSPGGCPESQSCPNPKP